MELVGKLKQDLRRIYGANDPLNYIEDIRAETNPDTQQEELVVRLRIPRRCEKYVPEVYITSASPYSLDYWAKEQALMVDLLSTSILDQRPAECKKSEAIPVYAGRPKKVFFNGNHTTLVWHDGSKTTVGVAPDEEFDEYTGFCTAIVKKLFGSSREAKKYMDKVKVVQKKRDKKKKPDMVPMPGTSDPDWGKKHWGSEAYPEEACVPMEESV